MARFKHDCDVCVFLGEHEEADLYFCGEPENYTVIARYSDDGPDYVSDVTFVDHIPALGKARELAIARGL
jgi:hypothetical protein